MNSSLSCRRSDAILAIILALFLGEALKGADELPRKQDRSGDKKEPQPVNRAKLLVKSTVFTAHSSWVKCLAYSPDGKILASGSNDQGLKLWDKDGKVVLVSTHAHAGIVLDLMFSPDGKRLVTASNDRLVKLWDVPTLRLVATLRKHKLPVEAAVFSPDGKQLATGSADGTVVLWDVATAQDRRTLTTRHAVFSVSFSPNGRWLAAGCHGGHVLLWDLTHIDRPPHNLRAHGGNVRCVRFSFDGQTLVSAGEDAVVKLWDVPTFKEIAVLHGHHQKIFTAAFARDGRTLVTAGGAFDWPRKPPTDAGEMIIWDVATGRNLASLAASKGVVFGVVFDRIGRTLALASADKTITLWDATALARRRTTVAALTAGEARSLWADLADDDVLRIHQAAWKLASAAKDAVPLLKEHLRSASAEEYRPKRIAQFIADLDNDSFKVRQLASRQLLKLGERAEPMLRQTLENSSSAEVRRRVEALLSLLEEQARHPVALRTLRAIAVLQRINTPAARALLTSFAKDNEGTRAGRAARLALGRLAKQDIFSLPKDSIPPK